MIIETFNTFGCLIPQSKHYDNLCIQYIQMFVTYIRYIWMFDNLLIFVLYFLSVCSSLFIYLPNVQMFPTFPFQNLFLRLPHLPFSVCNLFSFMYRKCGEILFVDTNSCVSQAPLNAFKLMPCPLYLLADSMLSPFLPLKKTQKPDLWYWKLCQLSYKRCPPFPSFFNGPFPASFSFIFVFSIQYS